MPGCTSEECINSRRGMGRELQQLREKFEYSQLQIESLKLKLDHLNEKLREATFRGRSSTNPPSVPSLPDEILHHVFGWATCFEGLACPAWDNTAGSGWKVSSLTRRCIPLVSRRWHAIGLEFLYEHVNLGSGRQISGLLHVLNCVSPSVREQRLDWIRGLEFSMPNVALQSIMSEFDPDHKAEIFVEFEKLALSLLQILPEGRLRRFGVDCGACDGLNTQRARSITIKAVAKSQGHLEVFHLSCAQSTQEELPNVLARVHTFSRVSRHRCRFDGDGYSLFANLVMNAHSIRKIVANCGMINPAGFFVEDYGKFLKTAGHLRTLHIHIRHSSYVGQLKRWLEEYPHLRHLLISVDVFISLAPRPKVELVHPLLEEITIYTEEGTRYDLGGFIPDLMLHIGSGGLSKLQRITVHGDLPEGCLDARRIFSSAEYGRWADALDWCTQQELAFFTHEGHPIHLWRRRHGPKFEAREVDDSSSTDGEEWFERSDTDDFCASDGSNGFISDDSDDAPYRYVHQPDIEQVISDSEYVWEDN